MDNVEPVKRDPFGVTRLMSSYLVLKESSFNDERTIESMKTRLRASVLIKIIIKPTNKLSIAEH